MSEVTAGQFPWLWRERFWIFFFPVPGCAAQPCHSICFTLQWPFLSLLICAAKQIPPLGQPLFQPEMLHMLLKHLQKPFSELSDWPKPMGPTPLSRSKPARSLEWKKSEENQVTAIKPHLYFRSGPHNLMSTSQQKIQPLLKPGHFFLGRGRRGRQWAREEWVCRHSLPAVLLSPQRSSLSTCLSWFTALPSTIPWQTFTTRQLIMGVDKLEVNPPQGATHLLASMKLTNRFSRLLLKRFSVWGDFLYNPQSQGREKTHFSN